MPRIKIEYTAAQMLHINHQKQVRKLANRAKRKALKASITLSGWKRFEGETLPPQACVHKSIYDTNPEGTNIFTYPGTWYSDYTYYRGDNPETATEWIVVTDNGGFYKVGAHAMLWHIPSGTCQALWSSAALKKTMKSLLSQGVTVKDPDYQT
jgi:hypothetical protein